MSVNLVRVEKGVETNGREGFWTQADPLGCLFHVHDLVQLV